MADPALLLKITSFPWLQGAETLVPKPDWSEHEVQRSKA